MRFEIDKYMPVVKKMASKMVNHLPGGDHYDDLIQAGVLGLVQAFDRFDDNRGIRFLTFAYPRIQGAMLDYLRETRLKKKWAAFHGIAVFHLNDEFDIPDKKAEVLLKAVDDKDSFDNLISGLDPDQKIVMTKAYGEDLKQREIAKKLNVSESWVSRLKIMGLRKIRRAE